ncbi:MAG: FABP family protein [Propionibacteriaceae bacterium]|nr:FABP family protein [Propionibacteriaceae bacterium]
MLGHWEGHGHTQWPGEGDRRVLQQIDFAHNGQPYLHYLLQVFLDDDGNPGEPVTMESGFWVPGEKNSVMAVICNPEGVAASWHGTITGLQSPSGGDLATKIELTTDAVLSQGTHTAGSRLYGLVHGKMMFAIDRADSEVPLQPWLSGELERR